MRLLNVGFGNLVNAGRIIAVAAPDSAPVKRVVHIAKEHDKLIDATSGKRTRAVIVMDSDHVVLSALQPETLAERLDNPKQPPPPELDVSQ